MLAARRPPSGGRSPPNFGLALILVSVSCLGIGFYTGLRSSEKQAATAATPAARWAPTAAVPEAAASVPARSVGAKREGSVSGGIKGGSRGTNPTPICTNTCAKVRGTLNDTAQHGNRQA